MGCAALAGWLAGCSTAPKPAPEILPTVNVAPEVVLPPATPLVAPQPALSAGATNGVAVASIHNNHRVEETSTSMPALLPSRWPTNWVNSWIPLADWAHFNGLPEPIRTKAGADAVFQVQGSNCLLVVQAGNRTAMCNGQVFWLGFIPRILKSRIYVHALDAQKFLQPLVAGAVLPPPRSERVVVIDPGHGGRDGGTQSLFSHELEKNYTLDWALRLRRLLETNGWRVVLTRTNDVDLPIPERIAIADRNNADLFISLHFNAAPANHALAGIETYCLTPHGLPASIVRESADDVRQTFPNNAYDGQNLLFAFGVQRVLTQSTGAIDRGVRHARFMAVLRGQQRPAVLIEGGYLSNAGEARKVALPSYRQKLAEALAQALK